MRKLRKRLNDTKRIKELSKDKRSILGTSVRMKNKRSRRFLRIKGFDKSILNKRSINFKRELPSNNFTRK